MKVKLIWVGKTHDDYIKKGIDIYYKRLQHYVKFEIIEIADIKNAKNFSTAQIKQKEGELILKQTIGDHLVLLDENGKEFNSRGFSDFFQKKMNSGIKCFTFIIGGAFGFSDDVYKNAQGKVSLSKMTFSHQMVRLFFCEQLYRANTILKGEPYHHD